MNPLPVYELSFDDSLLLVSLLESARGSASDDASGRVERLSAFFQLTQDFSARPNSNAVLLLGFPVRPAINFLDRNQTPSLPASDLGQQ